MTSALLRNEKYPRWCTVRARWIYLLRISYSSCAWVGMVCVLTMSGCWVDVCLAEMGAAAWMHPVLSAGTTRYVQIPIATGFSTVDRLTPVQPVNPDTTQTSSDSVQDSVLKSVYNSTQNSVRASVGDNPHGVFSADLQCEACHTSESWVPAREPMDFDHSSMTRFALIGRHQTVSCESCHTQLVFSEPVISGDGCETCHVDVHEGAFSETCSDCHDTISFSSVDGVMIHQRTSFQLLGAHAAVSCESCHDGQADGHFVIEDTECFACHEDDYMAAESFDHAGRGVSTRCEDCHTMFSWEDAFYEHAVVSGGFELLGAHDQADCASCHTPDMGLVFNPPPMGQDDCFTCHVADYNEEHANDGYPTDCTLCHNVNDWDDAEEFTQHDALYFPIYSGEHRNEWDNNCQSCHITPGNFTSFSCIDCHEHNQPEMNDEHDDVSGYIYQSEACYSCHPNGSEDDADGGDDDDDDDDLFRLYHPAPQP